MSFWRALAIFSGLSVIMPLITDICLPAIPDIARYYGVETGRIQQTISFLFFGAALGQIVYGPLADRFGRKPIIVVTMLVFTLISFVTVHTATPNSHSLARFLQGATGAGGMIIVRAIVRDLYDGAVATKMFAYTMVGSSLMPILAPIVGGHVTELLGWKPNFYIIAGFGMVLTLSLVFWLEETGKRDFRALETKEIVKSFIILFKSKIFVCFTFITLGPFTGLLCLLAGLSTVLIDFMGVSASNFGYYFAIIMFGNLLASILAGKLSSSLSSFRLIVIGALICFLSGTAAYIFAFFGIANPLSIVIPAAGFMIGFPLVVSAATAEAMAPFPEIAGKASSLIGLIQLGCGAVVSLILGWASDGTHLPLVLALLFSGILTIIPLRIMYNLNR
ncbi:multidrug effflux MFS transporter [Gammaproteobacteria bacterium]|nr:multidrug effflux MFS transporter [Gammaproteobacteria bacterium]